MASEKKLGDLLQESYIRINDLNGLVKKRDMEEVLKENALKSKMTVRNTIANLHQLLDLLYEKTINTIDSTVADISDTLVQHSHEINDCVTYMAHLCLIAEKVLKGSGVANEEYKKVVEKLEECHEESEVLKTVDYKACVSLDVDVNMKELFALPIIHILSHIGDKSTTKLHSLRFKDLRQKPSVPAGNRNMLHRKLKANNSLKQPFQPLVETSIKGRFDLLQESSNSNNSSKSAMATFASRTLSKTEKFGPFDNSEKSRLSNDEAETESGYDTLPIQSPERNQRLEKEKPTS